MAVTITGRPYGGLSKNINPVYNGLGFIVDSDKKYNTNMKYICEIFIGDAASSTKIGELRHNPDISNTNKGVFDVGRIVEDYITYELTYDLTGMKEVSNAYKRYFCRFGEEFSRTLKVTSVISGGIGLTKIYVSGVNNCSVGDKVFIQGCNISSYNDYFTVSQRDASSITINTPYVSGVVPSSMYLVQGIAANLNIYTGSDGQNYYKFNSTNNTISIGDTFYAKANSIASTLAFLNGSEWSIINKTQFNTTTWTYYTNIPYQVSILGSVVSIIPKGNYVIYNQVSTVNDNSIAFNGVLQYDEFNYWKPEPYKFRRTDTSGRMLTKRPRKAIKLCSSEYFTLSSFAEYAATALRNNMPTQFAGYIAESYNPPTATGLISTTGGSSGIYESLSSGMTGKLAMQFSGNQTSDFTRGSYVNIVGKTSLGVDVNLNNVRIMYVSYSYPNTYLIIDTPWSSSYSSTSFNWTVQSVIKVIIRSIGFDYTTFNTPTTLTNWRVDVGCGPKNLYNLGYTEYGTTAYKYFITPYGGRKAATGPEYDYNGPYGPYSPMGETFTFDISCNCSKFHKWTLFWMNELGGWDWFNFDKRSDKFRNIERGQFGRHLKSPGVGKVDYTMGQKGTSTYNTKSRESLTLRTGFLTQEELDWISYIYESPEVYILEVDQNIYQSSPTPKVIPVNVTNDGVELFNKVNVGDNGTLYNITLNVQMANERTVQRGSNFGGYFYNRS
jgi:hypothetical protein